VKSKHDVIFIVLYHSRLRSNEYLIMQPS